MLANFTHYRIIIGEGKISENNDKLFKIVLLSQLNEEKIPFNWYLVRLDQKKKAYKACLGHSIDVQFL